MTHKDEGTGFAAEIQAILMGFESELCDNCAEDLEMHVIGADPLGHAHIYCIAEMPDKAAAMAMMRRAVAALRAAGQVTMADDLYALGCMIALNGLVS